jgi:DNA-binding CsgD family transcriptional regulator
MLNWEEIVRNYTVKHSNRIKSVTRPLRDHFGISCFFHINIDYQGKLIWLGDRPDCAEYYVSKKYFKEDPCMKHPSYWESGFSLLKTVSSDAYKKTFLDETENLFNMNSWIIFSEKTCESVKLFGFVSDKPNCLEKIYLNHPYLLKLFTKHFQNEMSQVIYQMQEEAISLADLEGINFQASNSAQTSVPLSVYKNFLQDINMQKYLKMADLLSKREKECLKLLLLHKSAKETAAVLNLSPRTIEFYFENIKNKLICKDKHEIFSLSKELNELGLL